MELTVAGFVGWLQMRGTHDSRVKAVDRGLTTVAGLMIVLGVYIGAQL